MWAGLRKKPSNCWTKGPRCMVSGLRRGNYSKLPKASLSFMLLVNRFTTLYRAAPEGPHRRVLSGSRGLQQVPA
eukprot:14371936-Alexandrium_andersonii.AAC.1